MRFPKHLITFLIIVWLSAGHAQDEDRFANVQIKTQQINDKLYVLFGQGGNIGLSVGEDGVFMIDDQFAPLTVKIKAAIRKLTPEPVSYIINTHWHFDHTGGNENLAKEGSLIVAHDNVHKRMAQDGVIEAFNMPIKASPKAALPVITFNDKLTFHLNGDVIRVSHYKNAHTDGDGSVHFTGANVIHTGDIWFNGMYPFIDVGSGGSIDGMITAAESMISFADAETVIIPGHGPVGDKAALEKNVTMLKRVRSRVQKLIDQGKTLEQIQAAKPNAADYDNSHAWSFITAEKFLAIVHTSLTQ
ncbi:MAG: MBL fold metallo-hydrolase [Gammaproteobacteria bacterium]